MWEGVRGEGEVCGWGHNQRGPSWLTAAPLSTGNEACRASLTPMQAKTSLRSTSSDSPPTGR